MAAVWRVMWLPGVGLAGPLSLAVVKAKAAAKASSAAAMMQASTMAAMRRRLKRAVWGAGTGWKGASGASTTAETGWAARRMEDHAGAADSAAGAVEIWVASTSKMRSCAASADWSASSRRGPSARRGRAFREVTGGRGRNQWRGWGWVGGAG